MNANKIIMMTAVVVAVLIIALAIGSTIKTKPIDSVQSTFQTTSVNKQIIEAKVGDKLVVYVCDNIYEVEVTENQPTKGFIKAKLKDGETFLCKNDDSNSEYSALFVTYSRMNEILVPGKDYTQELPKPASEKKLKKEKGFFDKLFN
jgi:hypothetical protein